MQFLFVLPVLPPPWSAPIRSELNKRQRLAWKGLLLADDPRCAYCRRGVSGRNATLDHVLPVSRGGSHEAQNLVLCCWLCNGAKGDRTAQEWLADLTRFCAVLSGRAPARSDEAHCGYCNHPLVPHPPTWDAERGAVTDFLDSEDGGIAVVCCGPCKASRQLRTPYEWLTDIGHVVATAPPQFSYDEWETEANHAAV